MSRLSTCEKGVIALRQMADWREQDASSCDLVGSFIVSDIMCLLI
jgi:hypothetical protein